MIKLPIDLKKNQPKVRILIILLSSVVFMMYFRLLLQPQLTRLTDIFSNMGKAMGDLKAAESDISKVGNFVKTIEAYREKVDQYEKRLPVEQEIPSLLESFSSMAKSSNIRILGITPVTASFKEPKLDKNRIYQEMPILISAKSGYYDLVQFLTNLENADRLTKVVDIDIKSNKMTPKKHDVELTVSTFILLKEK